MSRFLLVGTVRDVEDNVVENLARIYQAFSQQGSIDTFLVESDSEDNTVHVLYELSDHLRNFRFISLGALRNEIPNRISRLRYCRNKYVEFIRDNLSERNWDYIIVADLDGVNNSVSPKSVNSNFELNLEWDAIFPNQTFGYYDLLALRCENWLNGDYLQELDAKFELVNLKRGDENPTLGKWLRSDAIRKQVIYSRMRKISIKQDPIRVYSAFGGLGIYKPKLFQDSNYDLSGGAQLNECEHVSFHLSCEKLGNKLFINPAFVNANFTTYNLNRIRIIRLLRYIKMRISNKINL